MIATAEARALADVRELAEFCAALEQYVSVGRGHDRLRFALRALAAVAVERHLPPERILRAMRLVQCYRPGGDDLGSDFQLTPRSRRYVRAIEELLNAYFAPREPMPSVERS